MHSMLRNSRHLLATAAVLCVPLWGCSGGGGGTETTSTPPPQRAAGMLSQVTNASALEQSLKQGLKQSYNLNEAPLGLDTARALTTTAESGAAADSSATGSFTNTYTLESGVDEADFIKYDGEILYSVSYPSLCVDCPQPLSVAFPTAEIVIRRTDSSTADADTLSRIGLDSEMPVSGLYLPESGRLVVLQSSGFYGICGVSWAAPWYWQEQKTRISVYDTSNPAAPRSVSVIELDGAYTASRQVDGNLILVSRYTPYIEDMPVFYGAEGDELEAAEARIEGIALADLIPDMMVNGQRSEAFEATDCYVPTDTDSLSVSPSTTTISVIPLNDPDAIQSSCYVGEAYGMYMSTESLYLTGQRYEYTETSSADFTQIHKFALNGAEVDYRGSAEIPGTLGHGEQLDFRLSEHDDLLRVVTSEYQYSIVPLTVFEDESEDAGADSIDHRVTILRESSSEEALETVSTLPNASQPTEIGKPDERLYGVRFFEDRAYMVTFQQIDPLYVIDLADPEEPRIAGELEIPGVADFLHPIADQLLLTIGRSVELIPTGEERPDLVLFDGLKVELLDVSDISSPVSRGSIEIGERGTYSEALYNRHAFTFQADFSGPGTNARFALPVDVFVDGEPQQAEPEIWNQRWDSSGLHLFELTNPADPSSASLSAHGQLTTASAQNGDERFGYYSGERRSIFHDDAIYFLSGNQLWSSFWSDPSILNNLN